MAGASAAPNEGAATAEAAAWSVVEVHRISLQADAYRQEAQARHAA